MRVIGKIRLIPFFGDIEHHIKQFAIKLVCESDVAVGGDFVEHGKIGACL